MPDLLQYFCILLHRVSAFPEGHNHSRKIHHNFYSV
nr:MAG TPA: hypothetical protein [Caudoviricetes sp.]